MNGNAIIGQVSGSLEACLTTQIKYVIFTLKIPVSVRKSIFTSLLIGKM